MQYPTILSLPDGTDITIAPTSETLEITISIQGCLPSEKAKHDFKKSNKEISLEDTTL